MNIENEDHRDVSEAAAILATLKDYSNRVLEYLIRELQEELANRKGKSFLHRDLFREAADNMNDFMETAKQIQRELSELNRSK